MALIVFQLFLATGNSAANLNGLEKQKVVG